MRDLGVFVMRPAYQDLPENVSCSAGFSISKVILEGHPMMQEHYDRLVRAIYEGVLSPDSWQPVLPELMSLAKAEQTVLLMFDPQSGRSLISDACGIGAQEIEEYEQEYAFDDPGRPFIGAIPAGEWYFDRQALDHRIFRSHRFYQEFMRKQGLGSIMWTPLLASNSVYAGLSFIRAHDLSPFQREDTSALQPLLPHLTVAAQLRWKFEALSEAARLGQHLLDQMSTPVLVIEKKARVLYANKAGQRWLSQARSPYSEHATLKQATPWPHLINLAKRICGKNPDAVATLGLPAKAGEKPVWLVGLPLSEQHPVAQNWKEPVGIVVVHNSAAKRSPWPQLMRALFGLTPAECRLAQQLVLHHSPAESSIVLAIGKETVKSQLKSIYRKTGINSQSALMQLITGLSHLPLAGDEEVDDRAT